MFLLTRYLPRPPLQKAQPVRLSRNLATQRLPMTGTIADMAMASAIAATVPLRIVSWKLNSKTQKGEPGGSPFLLICCVASEARQKHVCFADDAHRKSGVISFGAALSPVES